MKRLVALGAAAIMVLAMAAPAAAAKPDKTWVCHATGSDTNPWVLVHVANGWDKGHGNGGPAVHQNIDGAVDDFLVELLGLKAGPLDARDSFVCEAGGPA
jgi:ABC-type sugar transport system substrate-binding protein